MQESTPCIEVSLLQHRFPLVADLPNILVPAEGQGIQKHPFKRENHWWGSLLLTENKCLAANIPRFKGSSKPHSLYGLSQPSEL